MGSSSPLLAAVLTKLEYLVRALAWNPATVEQRTRRIDRIGSKTFRERNLVAGAGGPFLEIGVPFLAGTYDERMFEELRPRSQTFEVLTGGDFAVENPEGIDESPAAEGKESGYSFVHLPDQMMRDLRVSLSVWRLEEKTRDAKS